jgi:hypothetical protein
MTATKALTMYRVARIVSYNADGVATRMVAIHIDKRGVVDARSLALSADEGRNPLIGMRFHSYAFLLRSGAKEGWVPCAHGELMAHLSAIQGEADAAGRVPRWKGASFRLTDGQLQKVAKGPVTIAARLLSGHLAGASRQTLAELMDSL